MPDTDLKPLPTREALKKFREDRLINGMIFPLNATSVGMEEDEKVHVRVRRISTIDRATLEQLPEDLKVTLYEGIEEFQREMKKAQEQNIEPANLDEMMANNDKIVKASKTFALAAFIHPRLVQTEAEIKGQTDVWTVDDIEAEDLVAIMTICLNADSDQVKKLKLFRPQRALDAANGQNLSVAETSVRLLEPQGTGVHGDGV